MTRSWKRLFKRFSRRDSGAVSVEFVIYLPLLLGVFMSTFEAGLLMARTVMLDRAMDVSMRDLRLGKIKNLDHSKLKNLICDRAAIIPECRSVLLLELRPVSTTTWEPLGSDTTCVDRNEEIQPVTQFVPGGSNEMMLVRACAVFDPIFPTTGLGLRLPKDASGGYAIVASSAFVNEPS